MRKILSLILIAMLLLGLLCGCRTAEPTEPSSAIPSGQEGISSVRTGAMQQGVTTLANGFECTDSGFYSLCFFELVQGNFLVYGDHNSDTIVKLCSRPDCTHTENTCNAYFDSMYDNICYYNKHLYTLERGGSGFSLVRMDLDGRNRTVIMDSSKTITGYKQSSSSAIMSGFAFFTLKKLDDQGNEIDSSFYYKLDGSMTAPEESPMGMPYGSDDDTIIFRLSTEDGVDKEYYSWTPEDGMKLLAVEPQEATGYYRADHCYQMIENKIYRIDYATGVKKLLLDTGLTGTHRMRCFPEFIVVMDATPYFSDEPPLTSQTLRFYNWNFELVDTLTVDYPISIIEYSHIICGETPNRFLLCSDLSFMPRWYIEKSEIGSGNLTIHPYNTPADLVWEE